MGTGGFEGPRATGRPAVSRLAWAAAWWIARGLLVACLADVFLHLDETVKGAEAKALLEIDHGRLLDRLCFLHEGGSVVASALKAAVFALVGESLLALKLAALVWGSLILWAGLRLLRALFGAGAEASFALLLILAPENVQKLSLLHCGTHWDAALFVLLALDVGLGIATRGLRSIRACLWFGLLLGFGTFFSYQVPVLLFPVALAAALRLGRARLGAAGVSLLAGALLGASPLLLQLARHGQAMLEVHGDSLLAPRANWGSVAALIGDLWTGHTSRERASAFLFPLLALAGTAALLWRARGSERRASGLLAASVACWTLVWGSSSFVLVPVVHYTWLLRLTTPWVVATVLLAAAAGLAWRERAQAWARAGLVGFAALLALGGLDLFAACAQGRPSTPLANLQLIARTRAVDYEPYVRRVFPRWNGTPLERLDALLEFRADPRLVLPQLAGGMFSDGRAEPLQIQVALEQIERSATSAAPQAREFLTGLGPWLAERAGGDRQRALELARSVHDGAWAGELITALGRFGTRWIDHPTELEAEIRWAAALPEAPALLRGIGWRVALRQVLSPYGHPSLRLRPESAREWIDRADERARADLRQGFEQAWRLQQLP